jgi:Predicted exporters of the RND superfamily
LTKLPNVSSISSPFSNYVQLLTKFIGNATEARSYVVANGLKGAPSFVTASSVSSDNSSFLITLQLNYTAGTTLSGGTSPSEVLTPKVENLTNQYLGQRAYVTGNGPIQYETQLLTQKSAFIFPFLFVVLAVAVGVTLRSFRGSLLTLLFVSLTTIIGYFSVFATGVLIGHVDYVVNYTLTAVLLGITTDYLVFIAVRYREELRGGRERAIEAASKRASRAVLISGLTVGLSLATFSLVPGFLSWGIVLLIAIIISTSMMVTLLPSMLNRFGGRIFPSPSKQGDPRKSLFYRAASVRRKGLAVLAIVLVAIPAVYLFIHLPTTYNFNAGLPSQLRSVQGLDLLQSKFGLYTSPIFILTNQSTSLKDDASTILHTKGVEKAFGPYLQGDQLINSTNISEYKVGQYFYFLVYTNYSAYSQQAASLVKELRSHGFLVGGLPASVVDLRGQNSRDYTLLELLIVVVVGLVLGISFRSWKYPLISLTGVFMSITWATGLLYIISRFLLGEQLIYLVPVVLFVILMSLGNDYTVFIISRIEEERDEKEGVPLAMAKTGGTVTSLGLILAVSLGVLALIPVGFLQQIGIGFVLSLIIDTFVIRTIYLPAVIQLMSRSRQRS